MLLPVVGGIALLRVRPARPIGRYLEAAAHQHRIQYRGWWCWRRPVSLPYLVISRGCSPPPEPTRCGGGDTWGAAWQLSAARDPAVAAPQAWCPDQYWRLPACSESLARFLTLPVPRKGVTRTLPLEIYLQWVTDPDAAVALSPLPVVVAALVVLGAGCSYVDRPIPGSRSRASCAARGCRRPALDVESVSAGEVFAVLGPAGCPPPCMLSRGCRPGRGAWYTFVTGC